MTRELKLALIIGVTLVLGVLVLISDYLSTQRRPQLADSVSVQPERTPPPPVVEAPRETPREEPGVVPAPAKSETRLAEALDESPVVEINQRDGTKSTTKVAKAEVDDALRKAIEERGGSIVNGEIKLPPAAGIRKEAIGGGVPLPRETSPIDEPVVGVKVAGGRGVPSGVQAGKSHTVVSGDSAFKIARQYLGDGKYWKKIIDANPKAFAADGQVKVGSMVVIPSFEAPAPSMKTMPPVEPKPSPTRLASKPAPRKPYTIRKGDTLHSIAKRELGSARRADEIMKLNKTLIKDPEALVVGVAIVLPSQE